MKYWALANQVCEIMNANAPLNTSRDESRDVQAVGKKNFRKSQSYLVQYTYNILQLYVSKRYYIEGNVTY